MCLLFNKKYNDLPKDANMKDVDIPNLNNFKLSTISCSPKYHKETRVASPANITTIDVIMNSFGNRLDIIYRIKVNIASGNVKLKPIRKLIPLLC